MFALYESPVFQTFIFLSARSQKKIKDVFKLHTIRDIADIVKKFRSIVKSCRNVGSQRNVSIESHLQVVEFFYISLLLYPS